MPAQPSPASSPPPVDVLLVGRDDDAVAELAASDRLVTVVPDLAAGLERLEYGGAACVALADGSVPEGPRRAEALSRIREAVPDAAVVVADDPGGRGTSGEGSDGADPRVASGDGGLAAAVAAVLADRETGREAGSPPPSSESGASTTGGGQTAVRSSGGSTADGPSAEPATGAPAPTTQGEERTTQGEEPADSTAGGSPQGVAGTAGGVAGARRGDGSALAEAAFAGLPVVAFVCDADGRLVRWSDRVPAETGLDDAALADSAVGDLLAVDGDGGAPDAGSLLRSALRDGSATARLALARDGELVDREVLAARVAAAGDPRVCVVALDVGDRATAEAELEAALEELRRSNDELERFAYVASHDLKEPLRMVSSYLQLLERRHGDRLDGEAREFLEFAVDGADRMRRMIDDLLSYSRVSRGSEEMEPVDADEVVAAARRNLSVAIADSDAEIQVDDLPTVLGDRSQLVKLFQNLLDNAIKYAGEGPPRVTVTARPRPVADEDRRRLPDEAGDRLVEFAVADEGVGIPADRRGAVFELFTGVDERGSTGIGLAIVQKIVERHGGRVRVESERGEGSTFSLTLPTPAAGLATRPGGRTPGDGLDPPG